MSPEIFQNKPYSYKSDVWALGCILYEMTTLNHAFDSSSLNGLAGKIVKGRYPPINPKYSQGLRDLVARLLLINPLQRPDMDQILRKSIVKKHIVNFLSDIMSRPVSSVGEGTMILKAAADVVVLGNSRNDTDDDLANDSNVSSLQKQLRELDLANLLTEAVAPRSQPKDPEAARRLAHEQSNALQREQEHRLMVEQALERLRLDRDARAKEKQSLPSTPSSANARLLRAAPAPTPVKALSPAIRVTALKQPSVPAPSSSKDRPSVPLSSRPQSSQEQASSAADARRQIHIRPSSRPPSQPLSARPQQLPQIPLRRRDSASASVTPRDDTSGKQEVSSARRREELSKKKLEEQRLEEKRHLSQQAEAQALRDVERELERQNQRDEIAQLRRDKVELDRRTEERLRLIKVRSEAKLSDVSSSRREDKSVSRPQESAQSKPSRGVRPVLEAPCEAKSVSRPTTRSTLAAAAAVLAVLPPSPAGSSKIDVEEDDPFFNKVPEMRGAGSADFEEDLHRKEVELQAELMLAAARCQELKRTLKETKRFLGADGSRKHVDGQRNASCSGSTTYPDDEDDNEDLTGSYSESEFDDALHSPSSKKGAEVSSGSGKAMGERNLSHHSIATPSSSKKIASHNQELPASSGRLTERIQRLRFKCEEGLGADVFRKAYRAVLEFEERLGDALIADNERLEAEKETRLLSIVGEGRLHYMSLLEQLIFMEESHGDCD